MGTYTWKQEQTKNRRWAEIVVTAVLILLALAVILPLILPWFFVFKTQLEFAYNPWGLPTRLRWENFKEAWIAVQIGQGLLNTVWVCLGAILCTVPPAAMAGYIFARYQSRVTEILFYAILVGYFVPVQMVLIPLYRMSIRVGLPIPFSGSSCPWPPSGYPSGP